jgi:HSP20 family molecular chaperone IbpA
MIRTRTIVVPAMVAALMAGSSVCAFAAGNEDVNTLKDQVSQLQAKVVELEKQLAGQQGKPVAQSPVMMGYDPIGPFAQMEAMEQQMQAMMARPSANPMLRSHAASFAPDYDVKATDKAYIISFDMPGMDKAKINVEVKNGVILVSGERSSESKEDQSGKFYRQERSFGYFSRSIPLPEDAKPESLMAKYENGVLMLTIDKKEAVKKVPAQQKIEVK